MAVIDEFQHSSEAKAEIPDWMRPLIQEAVGKFFWGWFKQHENDKLISIGWWFIKKTVRVHDLHGLFELLFGAEPA